MYSAEAALDLANELVVFLRRKFRDTHRQREWTQRNIRFLRQFARKKKVQSFPSAEGKTGKRRAKQFLWDYIAHQYGNGIVIAAESEHKNDKHSILYDFDKLLYVRSPVKLMMCRVRSEREALKIRRWAQRFMENKCKWYSPSEVFVLYCVWWSGHGHDNRDFAYFLQIKGECNYCGITTERFEAF